MAEFRWQALFGRVREPLFVLNRQRRIIFVNHAWETLTGVSAAEARRWVCTQRQAAKAGAGTSIARVLWPPPEVLNGKSARARRSVEDAAGAHWWDIEFVPLCDEDGVLCVLGRIAGPAAVSAPGLVPLMEAIRTLREGLARQMLPESAAKLWRPEQLVAIREKSVYRFRLELLASPLPAMQRLVEQARLASSMRTGVFLTGEPGTGKEWLARAIHYHGPNRERAVAVVDCAHLPAAVLGELLFAGKGLLNRPGVGTVYLKEPSRLAHDIQNRLIEWMAEPATSGPCVIAGSTANPQSEIGAGRLLEKLYSALATLVIVLPPLRERLADLEGLIDQFLDRMPIEKKIAGLTPAALELMREYRWPGNLRELRETLVSSAAHASGDRIDVSDLPAPLRLAVQLEQTPGPKPEKPLPLDQILEDTERRLIELALRRTRGNKSKAAELLGIVRPRLFRRIEALGLGEKSSREE
jgi:DNA-binding NtrC family response regulator